jgi:hypothetical protein
MSWLTGGPGRPSPFLLLTLCGIICAITSAITSAEAAEAAEIDCSMFKNCDVNWFAEKRRTPMFQHKFMRLVTMAASCNNEAARNILEHAEYKSAHGNILAEHQNEEFPAEATPKAVEADVEAEVETEQVNPARSEEKEQVSKIQQRSAWKWPMQGISEWNWNPLGSLFQSSIQTTTDIGIESLLKQQYNVTLNMAPIDLGPSVIVIGFVIIALVIIILVFCWSKAVARSRQAQTDR